MIKEQGLDENCFSEGTAETKAITLKNVLGLILSKDGFCSLEAQHDKKNCTKTKVVCFEEEIVETNTRTPRNCPGFNCW
jgi:hypothetical protein